MSRLLEYVVSKRAPEGAYLSNSGVVALSSPRGAFSLQVCMSNLQALKCLHTDTVLLSQMVLPDLPVYASMQERAPPDEVGSVRMPVSEAPEAAQTTKE